MKSVTYQRYYEKNKEALKEKMRIRDAERREAMREYLTANPEAVDLEREKMRGKYYNTVGNKIRRDLTQLMTSPTTSEIGRAFLAECLVDDKYKAFTPKMVEAFKILYASPLVEQTPLLIIDGTQAD